MVRKNRALIKEPNSGTLNTAYGFTLFREIIFRNKIRQMNELYKKKAPCKITGRF